MGLRRVAVIGVAVALGAGALGWGLLPTRAGDRHGSVGVSSRWAPAASAGAPSALVDATTSSGPGSARGPAAPIARFRCPAATVTVSTPAELKRALAAARPGQVIGLADGVYPGTFTVTTSGAAGAPIYLCGGPAAVVQGRSISTGYGLHLKRVAHWRISGFTVRQAQKGIVLDASTDVGLQDLRVEQIGDEGVHLRENSRGDVVRGLTIQHTGMAEPDFGEGIYVGSAKSNWSTLTDGWPDRSDQDYLLENVISGTTAESVDIKEGTSAGVVAGNRFDGTGMTAATAWVNVKGNRWVISGNRGVHTPRDGFQTHVVLAGWGQGNRFEDNRSDLGGSPDGVAVRVQEAAGNQVSCTNTAGGGHSTSNLACVPSS
jgi:Periplasmic copper-binding protein (NosD)